MARIKPGIPAPTKKVSESWKYSRGFAKGTTRSRWEKTFSNLSVMERHRKAAGRRKRPPAPKLIQTETGKPASNDITPGPRNKPTRNRELPRTRIPFEGKPSKSRGGSSSPWMEA
jgi:hypothetical protein